MTEKKKPAVIILESNDEIREHAKSILSGAGWDVTCENTSEKALNLLSNSKKSRYALFITSYKLPKMKGEDILQNARVISPLTQRMLLAPPDKSETLISAINKAEINACITLPLSEDALKDQAKNCFQQFKRIMKKRQSRRVTVQQNRQMRTIAQKLKKKEESYQRIIDQKNSIKTDLTSHESGTDNLEDTITKTSLSDLFEQNTRVASPDTIKDEFMAAFNTLEEWLNQLIERNTADPVVLELKTIINNNTKSRDKDKTTDEMIEKTIKSVLFHLNQKKKKLPDQPGKKEDSVLDRTDHFLEKYFDVTISKDKAMALFKKSADFAKKGLPPTLNDTLDFLREYGITHGILEDEAIQTWISDASARQIVIAEGEKPVYGRDGHIDFQFVTDYTNPGEIKEDGSIDFKERGAIPYVKKDVLLARKTPYKESKPGLSVSGIPIPVDETLDPPFIAGPGTRISEDNLTIFADSEGQPHLDALGTISVNPELVIAGDVDFETGNIHFNGNIIVNGRVKEGFIVKGIGLTANEIEGGIIELSGDLNVSAGITDATISAHGNIYAKFIHKSTVMGFQNITISKEIIDSDIRLSGSCQNATGHIINSRISAKLGIEAGKIGTPSSKPAKLTVGSDEHIDTLMKQNKNDIKTFLEKMGGLKETLESLEQKEKKINKEISEKTKLQDHANLKAMELQKIVPGLEKSDDKSKLQQVLKTIKSLLQNSENAREELSAVFETQDNTANKIQQIATQMVIIERKNKKLQVEQKGLKAFSKKEKGISSLTVPGTIIQGSTIKGPNASTVLRNDESRVKFKELMVQQDETMGHEINMSAL